MMKKIGLTATCVYNWTVMADMKGWILSNSYVIIVIVLPQTTEDDLRSARAVRGSRTS